MVMGRRVLRHGSECCQLGQTKTVLFRETHEVDKNLLHVISGFLLQVLVLAHQLYEHLVACLDLHEVGCVAEEATLSGDHLVYILGN